MNKYLIVRFSSFGDIAQALPAAQLIRKHDPMAQVHWLTRNDFSEFVQASSVAHKVWSLDRKTGFGGLWQMIQTLKGEHYTHLYDAHNNLRSRLVSLFLRLQNFKLNVIRRSKNRLKRILLFQFRINLFPKPFLGISSYLEPLSAWISLPSLPPALHFQFEQTKIENVNFDQLKNSVVLAPSATWELKRWPTDYWIELVKLCPNVSFILLGGEQDTFCNDIARACGAQITNLVGQLSWLQSTKILCSARALVSGDTGLLHVADIAGQNAIAILGPTAFGHPSRTTTRTAEIELYCRPCTKDGRGRCRNAVYKKCLVDVSPQIVAQILRSLPA